MNSNQKKKTLRKSKNTFSKQKTNQKSSATEHTETVKGVASIATKNYPNLGGATFT